MQVNVIVFNTIIPNTFYERFIWVSGINNECFLPSRASRAENVNEKW